MKKKYFIIILASVLISFTIPRIDVNKFVDLPFNSILVKINCTDTLTSNQRHKESQIMEMVHTLSQYETRVSEIQANIKRPQEIDPLSRWELLGNIKYDSYNLNCDSLYLSNHEENIFEYKQIHDVFNLTTSSWDKFILYPRNILAIKKTSKHPSDQAPLIKNNAYIFKLENKQLSTKPKLH